MSTREITLDGGSPWGFRMHGGADVQQPLRISRVNPGSKAAQRGIREGDFISSINGQSTRGITNQEAHALLRNAGDTLTLGLNQENIGSPKRRVQKIQQDSKEDSLKRTSIASTSSTLSNISTINRILSNSYQSNESTTHTNGLGTPREAEQFTVDYISYKKNNGTSTATSRGAIDVCQSRDTPDDDIVISDHNQLEHHTIIARPSACNVEAHTATDSDTQVISVAASWQHCATASDNTADPLLDTLIMADNVNGSSRSRKQRRSRSNRKRSKKCTAVTQNVSVGNEASTSTPAPASTQPIVQSDIDDNNTLPQHVTTVVAADNNTTTVECVPRCDIVAPDATDCSAACSETTTYRVESPKTVRVEKKTTIASSMVKSRSLDDDDQVKITEITAEESAERTVCVSESTAIVSEAESDVEWEVVGELEAGNVPSGQHFGKLSVISLPLQEHRTYEPSYISAEDERSLRDFLQGLNLVNSPEESVQRIEKTSTETAKSRRSKKRDALAQHFLPYYQNPRFLDVISEEGSDTSDKDNRQASAGVLRCIVNSNNTEYLEDEDDVFEEITSVKEQKLRNRFQSHFTGSGVGEGAILVGTKLIETGVGYVDTSPLKEATWSTTMTEIRSGAEVVYLEDSSESMTPSDLLDETTGDLDADDEDDISIDLDKSFSESLEVQTSDSSSLIKSDVTLTSSSDNTVSRASLPTDITTDDQIKLLQRHPSPPTPDHISANNTPAATSEVEISNPLDEKSIDSLPRLALTSPKSNKDVNISFSDNINANSNSSAQELYTEIETDEQRSLSEGLNKVINDISNLQNEKQQQNGGENEEELNREIKLFCENLNKAAAAPGNEYSSGAGGSENDSSRPNSSSSACSSSRSTSQCTAVYNPVHSSLTNIAAMLREGSCDDRVPLVPSTLRELCVRALLTMPFGKEMIEELADVSLSIEEMTSETPSRIQNIVPIEPKPEPVLPPPSSSSSTYHYYQSYEPNKSTNTDASSVILVNNKHCITDKPSQPAEVNRERWMGLPTEFDPNLLVYLSPSQRNFIDTTKIVPNEADSLLDLHRKFIERRGYHEEYEMPPPTSNKEIPPFQINIGPQIRSTYSTENNLLKILQNAAMHTNVQQTNISDMNYNTSKQNSLHNVHINYNNYVKQFTKEIPTQTVQSRDGGSQNKVTQGNICYDKYIKQLTREVPIQVERQIHKPVNNKIYEAACSGENRIADGDESSSIRKDQRLNARHLGEWLNLARNEDGNKRHNYTECLTRVSNLHSTVNQLVTQRSYEENTSRTRRSNSPRRHSLPFNLYEQQMQYILEKEHEIQREIEKLNEEKAKLETDMTADEKLTNETTPSTPAVSVEAKIKQFDAGKYQISRKGDIAILQTETEKTAPKSNLSPTTEKFRQEMYHEYMCKIAERQERKQNKVIKIKITSSKTSTDDDGGGGGGEMLSPQCEVKHACGIEDEFMSKVRERKGKLGLEEDEREQNAEDEGGCDKKEQATATKVDDNKDERVLVIDGTTSFADTKQLPKHLQEFVDIARASSAAPDDVARRISRVLSRNSRNSCVVGGSLLHEIDSELTVARGFLLARGVWSPGKGAEPKPAVPERASPEKRPSPPKEPNSDEPSPVVWTPRSAGSSPTADRKEFRPVSFESPVLGRKNKSKESTPVTTPDAASTATPPWEGKVEERTQDVTTTLSLERRLTTSHSAPAAGLNNLSKLPRAQNPTITLLQKAREGQLPRGASYIEQQQHFNQKQRSSKDDRPPLIGPNEILYTVKNEYMSESDSEKPKKMADLGPRKFEGIGPTTKDGMPIVLRSPYDHQEIKDSNQAKWYKRMYDTLHRSRHDDEYVTVRYKTHRGRYPYTSAGGYLSEPEPNAYDSDVGISASKYATLDRRRLQPNRDKENEYITYTIPRNKYMSASVKHSTDVYKNQPGRIEDYVPGHSSISEKEAKEWWDEVMEIFDGWLDDHSALPSLNYMLSQVTTRTHLEQQKHVPSSKSYMSHALKESGYESDSTLVFRRREDAALQLNPHDQKEAYKSIQRGGEVPLHGLRKPAPERPKDDSDIEYFPISPTLTRIRVHKNVRPISEILCYPLTVHHQPLLSSTSPSRSSSSQVFSTYKRTAPSSTNAQLQLSPKLPTRPPSPPKRRSSRNSHTLRLISTMTIHTHSPKSNRRHETCFKSTADKSNVKFLRDRISCKLRSPTNSKKGVKVTKTISTYPSSSKESITTSVSSGRDSKLGVTKAKNKTDVSCKKDQGQHYSRSTASSTAKRCCHHCSFSVPPKLPDTSKISDKVKHRGVSLERTFGTEKRKVDLTLPKMSPDRLKLVKSPDLVSPTEVKKGVQRQKDLLNLETKYYPPGTTIKKSTSLFSSTKNGLKSVAKPDEKALNVTVAITQRGKELLSPSSNPKTILKSRSPSPLISKSPSVRNIASPAPSNISDKSKTSHKSRTMSVDSLQSSTLKKRTSVKPSSVSRLKSSSISSKDELSGSDRERKRSKKVKKDQSNEELKKEKKKSKENKTKDGDKTKTKKCAGRAAGSEIVRKLKKMEKIPKLVKQETIAEKQKDILQSDSFFQHLFLRDILSSPTYSIPIKSSYVMERTKMLQNHVAPSQHVEPTVKALKVYLTHRKPVSGSKFMTLDRETTRSRSTSPLVLSRSLSERRPRFDSISELSNEESICGKRSISPESIYSRRSSSLPATKMVFSETSRPVSPVCDRSLVKYGKRNSPSPSPIRSPSRRKIHSIKPPASITVEGISGVKKKAVRARSAGEVESMKRELYHAEKSLTPSVSSVSLSQITDPHEYKTYVTELRHSAKKCDRFKELNHFYSSLERLSQLELTTSSSDLLPRRRHEDEIIDYDRWMQVRTRERAEQEFNYLYSKLKQDQKEKDLLFRPKDIDKFRWKHDREFAFRLKENSVENIKEKFEQLKVTESPLEISKRRILDYQKDVYKPLWRGSSVLNLVSKIGDRRSQSDSRTAAVQQKMVCSERILTREIGTKLWSSLSVEQVNALKHQLAEIYSQTPQKKQDEYSINVEPHTKAVRPSSLVIRRNSANELSSLKPQIKKNEYVKSSSIGALASSQSLSENEKRRLSMSLSKEVHDKMTQRRKYISSLSVVLGKETRGAIAAAEANVKPVVPESTSPRTCYSLEPAVDEVENKRQAEKDFLLVLTKDESEEQKQNVRQTLEEWAQPKSESVEVVPKQISSTSETESASSDTSTKTAIFLGKKDELHKKIEYFERGADIESYVPTIHRPADDDNDLASVENYQQSEPPVKQTVKKSSTLAPSQSYADLKELFGEQELMKFATLPLSATRKQMYTSPQRPLLRASNISPIRTLSEASSCESLFRSRSMSPESEKFWNAYLALIKGVDVRKLTEKFETLKDFYSNRTSSYRRSKSDTELLHSEDEIYRDREFGDVYWLKKKYENIGRGRSRTRRDGKTSPISRIPLRIEDRLMPHINIISKLASLYPKKALTSSEKQKSVEDLAKELGCPVGEVEKIREKFESPDRSVSLLGHMFTSSPNVHELRDIAPYLAGQWIAHQYPRYQDNTRSLSAPEETAPDKFLVRKDHRSRPKSASPPRSRKQPSSILKSHHQQHRSQKDIFANQYYNPSVHRPTYRYQRHSPRAVDRGRTRSWSPSAKHTVTFKEPVLGPTPPPKGRHDIRDIGPESPRKYVEDEVTIHYRSPVRHEIKEVLSEEELARRQAEAMRRIYQEERRRKYLQELQDMNSRRHTDNFIPSQKSPIPLNRYDDFVDDLSLKVKPRDRSPEPRLVARAMYNFVGQSSRELTFRKGDIIFIRRQVDKNWYEGEHNAMIGLFPFNYVEIIPYDGIKSTPRKAHEGQARAKFNFIAQTHLELSLAKGELVVLTRRVDDNWYEGRIGSRKGIFPVSYVEMLIDPSEKQQDASSSSKPVASPAAHSLLLNGSAGGKESMGSHHYQPSYTAQPTTTSYHAKPVNVIGTSASYTSLSKAQKLSTPPVNEALHIDTHSEPVPYRALYKYRPQNDDELELQEGDTVFVLEKCDDGWYVGSSQRTGAFGTFPGNYVERI